MSETIIAGAARTAIGSFGGALSRVPAPRLGAAAIAEAVRRAGVPPADVDEVYMGCVLTAGAGQAPARQAALYAGLPKSVRCTTVGKVCGSGLKSVMLGDQAIRCGDAEVVVAGGMENMSMAPYLLPQARSGHRMGHGALRDSMILDGLWDPYNDFHMGNAAELCAREKSVSREEQDAFAAESYRRALEAIEQGLFSDEIAPVEVPGRKGETLRIDRDEEPGRGSIERIPSLRPAFDKSGTVTAANASSINDGAAALVLTSAARARSLGLRPLARIVAQAGHAQDPAWFTTAPVYAIEKVLAKAGLTTADIDLFEINEAFSVVSCAVNRMLDLDPARVNVAGGAVALGHPIGASGARILVTLLYAMRRRNARRGLASLCIGGGEAVAVVVEREAND
ncbi:MAG: acetyl-CoA C-acetyltransferase [Deltaproteobacteria bacterium]|nr:MAG: acetyl-CoA C-acetyltransferase [Deltaproteobacteria bacterium]